MVAALVTLALALMIISSMWVYPHSLSYFNELSTILPTALDASYPKSVVGSDASHGLLSSIKGLLSAGPCSGPRHLQGSSVDWGQDLFYLEEWYESHSEARPIRVAYFGNYPMDRSTIGTVGLPPAVGDRKHIGNRHDPTAFGPLPGWYALSVNYIYNREGQYRYFLYFEPVAMAGYSIYIYHITLGEANRVRRELGLKELTGDGGEGKGETKG